jgi:hypothetical protein
MSAKPSNNQGQKEGGTRSWHGVHCTIAVSRPASGIAVLQISGHDVGEFGAAPMQELERQIFDEGTIELFIDARDTEGASIDVSGEWAQWLSAHRSHFRRISILTGSRLIEVTASFVRRFAELGEIMRIYSDKDAFDQALAASTEHVNSSTSRD